MTGTVTVNVTDDDTAAIVFTGAPVAVTEGAAGVSYTVALGTQPSASVTVDDQRPRPAPVWRWTTRRWCSRR